MTIRVDVAQLKAIASQLRSISGTLNVQTGSLKRSVNSLNWSGKAFQVFTDKFKPSDQKLSRLAGDVESYARSLEALADAFYQADLEQERRQEQARQAQIQAQIQAQNAHASRSRGMK